MAVVLLVLSKQGLLKKREAEIKGDGREEEFRKADMEEEPKEIEPKEDVDETAEEKNNQ